MNLTEERIRAMKAYLVGRDDDHHRIHPNHIKEELNKADKGFLIEMMMERFVLADELKVDFEYPMFSSELAWFHKLVVDWGEKEEIYTSFPIKIEKMTNMQINADGSMSKIDWSKPCDIQFEGDDG